MRDTPGLEWWPPKHRVDSSALCKECQAIDFRAHVSHPVPAGQGHYFQNYERDSGSYHQTVKDWRGADRPVNDPNCPFCRYLVRVRDPWVTGKYWIIFHKPETQESSLSRCDQRPLGSRSEVCIAVDYTPFPRLSLNVGPQIVCHLDKPTRRPGTPQVVSPVVNVSLAKAWLDACNRNHLECTVENDVQMPETRLIDCVTRKLILAGDDAIQNPRFVALSYVWGPTAGATTLTEDLPSELPLTIRDAMTVTKDLGFHYLWVDQYCIDQSDNGDKDRQIRHMDLIYKCADITIIAAAGSDCNYGLPGVSDCSRDVLDPFILDGALTFGIFPKDDGFTNHWESGTWNTRGWTFQEAHLSRRRLVFSNTAMHFECMRHGEYQTEMCGGVECANGDAVKEHDSVNSLPKRRRRGRRGSWGKGLVDIDPIMGDSTLSRPAKLREDFPQPVPHQNLEASIFLYTELVAQYTRRELSHASDGLNAFRGAANALKQFDPPVYSIAGIPFVVHGHGEDNLIEATFSHGLAWWSHKGGVGPDAVFPSWSWGNVGVWRVLWNDGSDITKHWHLAANTIDHLRDVYIEFNTNGRKESIGLAEFAEACRDSTPVSWGNPTALCFKARILSSHVTTRMPAGRKPNCSWGFWGLGHHGLGREFRGDLNLVVSITGTPCDEQSDKSGERGQVDEPQAHCLIEIENESLCDNVVSGRWGFMLLRCNREVAQVLVVEWQHEPCEPQKTARRIGMIDFVTGQMDEENHADEFLSCFSNETGIRLI